MCLVSALTTKLVWSVNADTVNFNVYKNLKKILVEGGKGDYFHYRNYIVITDQCILFFLS